MKSGNGGIKWVVDHSGFPVALPDQDEDTTGLGISLLGLNPWFAVKPEEVQVTCRWCLSGHLTGDRAHRTQ